MDEIVVGVDGSAASDEALRFAFEEARAHHCRLVVLHAWSLPMLMTNPYAPAPVIDAGELEASAKEVLEDSLQRVLGPEQSRDVPVEPLVVSGHAAEALIERAGSARELVVGSRGRGGFAGLLLGSVGQHCTRHAGCPVVIVRGARRA